MSMLKIGTLKRTCVHCHFKSEKYLDDCGHKKDIKQKKENSLKQITELIMLDITLIYFKLQYTVQF